MKGGGNFGKDAYELSIESCKTNPLPHFLYVRRMRPTSYDINLFLHRFDCTIAYGVSAEI